MTVALVDWLGRGGIAHTSAAWVRVLGDHGTEVAVITRPDCELGADEGCGTVVTSHKRRARVATHVDLARTAATWIEQHRPHTVVVQNYVIPFLERPVYDAARRVGARVVLVVHNHRVHVRFVGTQVGLRTLVHRADVVCAHSHYVARELEARTHRAPEVLPLPVQLGVLGGYPASPDVASRERIALHFGVLKRRYKGTSLVEQLADSGVEGWRFRAVGLGAPIPRANLETRDEFLPAEALVGEVRRSAVTLLPYRVATQSGAVVLAQALGSVVVTTGVGGIPEQVVDGATGLLVPPAAGPDVWQAALAGLGDGATRQRIAEQAWRARREGHACFEARAIELAR